MPRLTKAQKTAILANATDNGAALAIIPATDNGATDNGATVPCTALALIPATDNATDTRSRAERVAAERIAAGILHRALDSERRSVPVKTISAFKRENLLANRPSGSIAPSVRQCAALAVAIIAAGKRIDTTHGAAVTFPRTFTTDAGTFCIENGAGRDCIVSGLATYCNTDHTFTVTHGAAVTIRDTIGAALLRGHVI
jgi:hypothetical protein